jgi:hypothetical protein
MGDVTISAPVAGCPQLTSFSILPSEVYVGSAVDLLAEATGPGGDGFDFSWTASNGHVKDAKAANTTFQCTEAGVAVLTITVRNPTDTNAACAAQGRGAVTCDPADAGAH